MPYLPLSQFSHPDAVQQIRLIASDMDGTLTQQGKFTSALLQALEDLAAANIKVLIVTGRSAGWVSGIVTYLPVVGAIAENGGLFYPANGAIPTILTTIDDINIHRQQLGQTFQQLQSKFPQLRESSDNRFRLTDWTFDVQGLNLNQLQKLTNLCHRLGWGFTYSNVQCHIKPLEQDKATGLLQVMSAEFPECTPQSVLTVGDSPNDESLFDSNKFPLSVGVNNVLHYTNQIAHQPTYITHASECQGFCELTQHLLSFSQSTQSSIYRSKV